MSGRYYKDPTADAAMVNVKRKIKNRKEEEERLRKSISCLFQRMSRVGMSGKEMVAMLKNEYKKFVKKCD